MFVRGAILSIEEEGGLVVRIGNRECLLAVTVSDEHRHIFLGFRTGERLVLDVGGLRMQGSGRSADGKSCWTLAYTPSISVHKDAFSAVAGLTMASYADLHAVVTACKPLTATRGTDYLFTLTIADETGEIDLKVFIPSPSDLARLALPGAEADPAPDYRLAHHFERVFRPGDVLFLRNVKLGRGGKAALIHKSCHITKLLNASEDVGALPDTPAARASSFLSHFYNERACLGLRGRKRIEDLERNSYASVLGKVLHMEHGHMSSACITDFTRSRLVPAVRKGKFELNMILYVNVYGRHTAKLKNVGVGDICLFENIKLKDADTRLTSYMSESGEGNISVVRDSEAADEINERERRYYEEKGELCDGGLYANNLVASDSDDQREVAGDGRFSPPADDENTLVREGPVHLASIRRAGVYLVRCRVKSYSLQTTKNGPCLRMVVDDPQSTLQVVARQRLTRLLVGSELLCIGAPLRCMILCLDSEKKINFMVSAFPDGETTGIGGGRA